MNEWIANKQKQKLIHTIGGHPLPSENQKASDELNHTVCHSRQKFNSDSVSNQNNCRTDSMQIKKRWTWTFESSGKKKKNQKKSKRNCRGGMWIRRRSDTNWCGHLHLCWAAALLAVAAAWGLCLPFRFVLATVRPSPAFFFFFLLASPWLDIICF